MKIVKEHYRLGSGKLMVNAFIKANPLERWVLTRLMRAGRHNLRPSRNWPGLRRHGASFILAAKGADNKDRGRKPGYWLWLERALRVQHSGLELWLVSAGMLLMGYSWLAGVGVSVLGVGLPRLLEHRRHKGQG